MARGNRTTEGTCIYCGAQEWLVPVAVLHGGFSNLLGDYITTDAANGYFPDALPPLQAMQKDWVLFSDEFMARSPEKFLPAVFEGKALPSYCENFSAPVVQFHMHAMSTAYSRWDGRFVDIIGEDDSAFTAWRDGASALDLETIATWENQVAGHLEWFVQGLPGGHKLWRARNEYVGSPFAEYDCQPLPLQKMGANPKHPQSRLNRENEAVLYCAESQKTALSEIRPGQGYFCTTCELILNRDIKVLDLTHDYRDINPFTCEHLSWKLDLSRVALRLTELVTKPTSRGEDDSLYSRTQVFAMITRAMHLDGIRFASSLDRPSGINLALFDPALVTYANARLVRVTRTEVVYEECS